MRATVVLFLFLGTFGSPARALEFLSEENPQAMKGSGKYRLKLAMGRDGTFRKLLQGN
jgi:hypothetical protein